MTAAAKSGVVSESGKGAYVCFLVPFCNAILYPCSQAALSFLHVLHCNATITAQK